VRNAPRVSERIIAADGAEICTEAFGDAGDPAVLLIMGQMASMLWWPERFCERLAATGRFVIRYDNRDTGRSTAYEPGAPAYTSDDLTDDAVAVLDGYGIERAHVVGFSAGGAIAQLVALRYPARVAGMTAISTTAIVEQDAELPGPDPAYLDHARASEELDWSDTAALADVIVRETRVLAGTRHPYDEDAARQFVARDLERTRNPASLINHALAGEGEPPPGRLADIAVPFTVIHGTADPLFPYEHGVALARAVCGAKLVTVEGGGHELHERDWDQIIAALDQPSA
jgi:pimeloyl-ACP methyl ester carboxylesterase